MKTLHRSNLVLFLNCTLWLTACSDDTLLGLADTDETGTGTGAETAGESAAETGDGSGDSGDGDGDGDGDPNPGDGDGDPGDGDGDTGDGDGDGDTGDGDGDTGDGDGDTGDGDGDTGDGDGDTGEGACADGCGTPNCGPCPDGPDTVAIAQYTMDATETSNEQYALFLGVEFTPAYLDVLMPPECGFKNGFLPENWQNNPAPDLPVVGVDWCDATAYCAWAGKRLCGQIGGGPADLDDYQNWANNEWYRACTQAGIKNYPYGLLYVGDACNTAEAGIGQRTNVGSIMSCQGGYAGLFDLSGNVWEWTNACNDMGECRRRGGSYFSDGPTSRCGLSSLRPLDFRSSSQGIRCCDTP